MAVDFDLNVGAAEDPAILLIEKDRDEFKRKMEERDKDLEEVKAKRIKQMTDNENELRKKQVEATAEKAAEEAAKAHALNTAS